MTALQEIDTLDGGDGDHFTMANFGDTNSYRYTKS